MPSWVLIFPLPGISGTKPGFNTVIFPGTIAARLDWDYAVVANSYIPPGQLQNRIWPPENAIHVVYADGVPVCAVLKRQTWDDLARDKCPEGRQTRRSRAKD